jgi:flagellar hook-associated protein 2
MAGISFSGLASGIDSEAMIAGLMQIERAPRARMELNAGRAQARDVALRDVLSKLKGVSDAAAALRSAALWGDVQTVESADPTRVSARRLSGTGPGGYQIQVSQLARAEQRSYDFTASATAAQITIGSATIDLAAGATLADAVAAVNAEPDSGVYAVAVGGRMVLSSRQTGAANGFTASSSTLAEDAGLYRAGLDAQFEVDGVAQTSASNTVADAVPGLELTLRSVTSTAVTVNVGAPGPDAAAIKTKLKAFVDQYNSAVDAIRSRLSEKRIPTATTQADANKGVLFGDTMLTGLLGSMRQIVSESGLGDLGIGTGPPGSAVGAGSTSVAGKLVLDEAKLAEALAADPAAVRETLAGTTGFAETLDDLLAPTVGAGGSIADRLGAAASELQRVRDTMAALDRRLEDREARLRTQFAKLETLLSQSQSQGQWLSGQLAGLTK